MQETEETYPLDDLQECENCGETIGTWVHSQMGSLKARAWTHDRPGDPRDNRYCREDPWSGSVMDKAQPIPEPQGYDDSAFGSDLGGI